MMRAGDVDKLAGRLKENGKGIIFKSLMTFLRKLTKFQRTVRSAKSRYF